MTAKSPLLKYPGIGPDNKIYVPVGAPCNICESKDPRFSTIMRMNIDGSNPEIYAGGIRNTVGFAWHPQTREAVFSGFLIKDRSDDCGFCVIIVRKSPADEVKRYANKNYLYLIY